MTASQHVDASLARAEAALASRDLADLRMAQASLIGCLDHSARQDASDEALVRAVLADVTSHLP